MRSSSPTTAASILVVPLLATLLLVVVAQRAGAVNCDVQQLVPCLPVMTKGTDPSAVCCRALKEQQLCMCKYMKDERLKSYFSNPIAPKVAASCGTPWPLAVKRVCLDNNYKL
ncbi:hypothetical protein SAY86_004193 [Trapa natans]|uniref:Bifunctional inhibitor/plant lipid transfer protein/seed storage helical domain-containing protein n=1 Tax=Trapa natans TaxID=22666 RepID=A0AAN7RNJ3_TRANT|nr:hypothetical protein SAY86_004193 [Trapa natans]